MIHCVHVAGAPTNGGFWWRLAAYDETPVFSVSAGQPGLSLVGLGAPGAIRTPAHGSGEPVANGRPLGRGLRLRPAGLHHGGGWPTSGPQALDRFRVSGTRWGSIWSEPQTRRASIRL
jgi:hypothetical protein